MSNLDWHEWGEQAFGEAERLERPIFLFLSASWCRFCKRMERGVLSDPGVSELLNARFVPVRVDKDRRPEVNDRYNLGGWPTLAVLTSDAELITGGTTFTVETLRELLERVALYYSEKRSVITTALQDMLRREEQKDQERAGRLGELSDAIVERVQAAAVADCDQEYGGFGTGQKFPHPEVIDFVLLCYVKGRDESARRVVEQTLIRMADSPLHDPVDGGFFRYSTTRDWRTPHTEKLLESNVGLLRNYLEAYQELGRGEFRRVAESILMLLTRRLRLESVPAFAGSLDSDDDYYALDATQRGKRAPPEMDRTVYVNWNAAAVSALYKASAVLEDPACARMAEETLGFLLEECYDQGRGMYHYYDGARHILGLLTDQAYTARALLHAAQFSGDRRYLDVAEDLLQILVAKQVSSQGGFYDIRVGANARGGLRRRNQSILENGLIAEVFLRAHHLTLRDEYLETAERTLRLFAGDYHMYGFFTAGYARAVDLFLNPPVHAVIVGRRDDPLTIEMAFEANRLYLPSKLVQVIDPEQDEDLLSRFDLPVEPRPVAFVNVRTAHLARATETAELVKAMKDAEAGRYGSHR